MKATVKLGDRITLEIEEQQEMETLHKAIVLANPRKVCVCGNQEGFYFTTNKSTTDEGTFTYVSYKCPKCGAKSKLGRYKAGGYFWNDFVVYQPKTISKEDFTEEKA